MVTQRLFTSNPKYFILLSESQARNKTGTYVVLMPQQVAVASRIMGVASLACFWILLLTNLWSIGAKRPAEDFAKPYPNVIYSRKPGETAKPGETCNFNHTNLNVTEVKFADFDHPCQAPSKCEYVFDKQGSPIRLSVETLLVRGDGLENGTATFKSPIYYKKCLCPSNTIFMFSAKSCNANRTKSENLGIFCSGAHRKTNTKLELILALTSAVSIVVLLPFN